MPENSLPLIIGHATHVGLEREINEDSYLILTPPQVHAPIDALLMVADGVGGEHAGEVASGLLTEMFWRWFANNDYANLVHYNPSHPDYFLVVLKDLVENANEHLYHLANSNSHLANMGTTATVAILSRGRLFLGHVGDTRAYLFRGGRLQQLTTDHSWVADEVAAGRLSENEARVHPKRNLVNRVLGASLLLRVDRSANTLQPNDMLVFTSDGLTGLVQDREIQEILEKNAHPQDACDQLITLANQRGGTDNITVLAVQVSVTEGQNELTDGIALGSLYLRQKLGVLEQAPATRRLASTSVENPSGEHVYIVTPPPTGTSVSSLRTIWHLLLVLLICCLMGVLLALLAEYNTAWPQIGNFQLSKKHLIGLLTTLFVLIGYGLGHMLPVHRTANRL